MDIYEVVKKLIGEIDPVGETNEDNKRYENLVELTGLIENLLSDIKDVAKKSNMQEYSISRSGKWASQSLQDYSHYCE